MKIKKIDSVLKEVLEKVNLSENEREIIECSLNEFYEKLKKNILKLKNKPEVFIGGSYAKKTLIKKDKYDIDIFLRYGKEYDKKNLSEITGKLLKNFKGVSIVHGSRDYYRIQLNGNLFIELVPVKKISSPKNSENITDLSYSHVKYVNKKIVNKKLLDDIKIAKAFCHANNCYGAESYIKGFSGYALELLVIYYKSFLKMVRELSKENKDKILIDIEKEYPVKRNILIDMNSSKLNSPVILIDPTCPRRNALAALSEETFKRFRKSCINFLKNPSIKYFEKQKIDLKKIYEEARKKKQEFLLMDISTDKQEGDVAGSKLLKFYNHLSCEIERFFEIKKKGFEYGGRKNASCFFVLINKKDIIYSGPNKDDAKNVESFKKEHKRVFIKKGRLYAHEKNNLSSGDFIRKWKLKNKRKIKEMSINGLDIIRDF